MELGTFDDFFQFQPHLSVSIPQIYYRANVKWGYNELLPGIIIRNPYPEEFEGRQEINLFQSTVIGWINMILMNLSWRQNIERQTCLRHIQDYLDNHYSVIRGPPFMSKVPTKHRK